MTDGSDSAQGSVQQEPAPAQPQTAPAPAATNPPPAQTATPAPLAPPAQLTPPTPPVPSESPKPSSGGWWTLPVLAVGIGLIACALIVAQAEENRQMSWQKNKLQVDVEHLRKQVEVNQDFLDRLSSDDALVERLAQRQMKLVREGSAALELQSGKAEVRSPFTLVRVPPPPEVQPYQPAETALTTVFGSPRRRLYAMGLGAILIAAALILGCNQNRP